MHDGLSSRSVYEAIAREPRIFPSVAKLAERLHCQADDLDAPLLYLAESGYVEVWQSESGESCVTLTPWAAELLGLVADDQTERWLTRSAAKHAKTARPGRKKIPSLSEVAMHLDADQFADPKAENPHEAASKAEEAASKAAAAASQPKGDYCPSLPRPRVLLGATGDWYGGLKRPPLCLGCADEVRIVHEPERGGPIEIFATLAARKMGVVEYCVRCDRSGVDHLLPKTITAPLSPSKPSESKRGKTVKTHAKRRPRKAKSPTCHAIQKPINS